MSEKQRFLLVDDQEEINLLMAKILAPYGDCTVATNGAEAVKHFSSSLETSHPFTAVFLDIMMPGMDGHQAADKLRAIERDKGVKPEDAFRLVMITALSDTKNVCKSFFRSGQADAYITKPIDKKKLLKELTCLGVIEA